MSETLHPSINQQSKVDNNNTHISRRRFLQGTAGVAGALVFESLLSKEAQAAPKKGKLAIVEGESARGESLTIENLSYNPQAVNARESANGAEITPEEGSLPPVSLLYKTQTPVESAGEYNFQEFNILYLQQPLILKDGTTLVAGKVEQPLNAWIYTEGVAPLVNPETGEITYPEGITQELIDSYTTPLKLPESGNVWSMSQMSETMMTSFGGNITPELSAVRDAAESSWSAEPNDTQSELLKSWKLANYMAASEVVLHGTEKSQEYEVVYGEQGKNPAKLFVHTHENNIDVITRLRNPKDEAYSDLFMISRANGNLDAQDNTSLALQFNGVAAATWEALVEAYGSEKAQEIAASTTILDGEEVDDAIKEMSALPESKVFLAGVPSEYQMAPKYSDKKGFNYNYFRAFSDVPDYRVHVSSIGSSDYKEYSYVPQQEGGEWVPTLTAEQIQPVRDLYANVMKLDTEQVQQQLSYEFIFDKNGKSHSLAVHGEVPLAIYDQETKTWGEATRSSLSEVNDVLTGVYVMGWRAKGDPTYVEMVNRDANHFQLDDIAMWGSLEPTQGQLSAEMDKFLYAVDLAKEKGKTYSVGSGLIWGHPDQIPAWLKNAGHSQEELLTIAEDHIETFLGQVKDDVQRISVVNEILPHLLHVPNFWTETNGIDRNELIRRSFTKAREVAPNAELAIREYSAEFAGSERADELFSIVKDMNYQQNLLHGTKLIDAVELQLPLMLSSLVGVDADMNPANFIDPVSRGTMMNRLRENIKRYREIGVNAYITELFVPTTHLPGKEEEKLQMQAEIYHDIFTVCTEEGVGVGIHRAQNGGQFPYPPPESNTSPYPRKESGEPTPAYYAINSALYKVAQNSTSQSIT